MTESVIVLPSNSTFNPSTHQTRRLFRDLHHLSDVLKCFLSHHSSSTMTEAEPCKLSRGALNKHTVVPETARPLATFWWSTRDFHTLRKFQGDTSSFIKAGLGCAALAASQTNADVINLNPCKALKGEKVNMRPLVCGRTQEDNRHTEPKTSSSPAGLLPWPWKCSSSLLL